MPWSPVVNPVADEFIARGAGLIPIAEEHDRVRPPDGDLAELARIGHGTVGTDDRHRMARHRPPDRAGARHADRRAGGEDQIAFGLPVELVDGETERRLSPFECLGAERFAAGAYGAQADVVAATWDLAPRAACATRWVE